MGIRDIINYTVKLFIQFYIVGIFTYILLSVGSDNHNYFWEAFYPLNWLSKITGNGSFLYIAGLLMTFFVSFDYLLRTKVDYWCGSWWYNATRWWWDDWF